MSQLFTLIVKCPIFTGNLDELDTISLSYGHLTWIGAPLSQSTYTMRSPFTPKLPKCHSILSYEAVEESPSGILTYPGSGLSWDIDSSVA